VDLVSVTEDFFEFFGTRAIAGRLFESADAARADDLVVIDAILAATLFPGEPAVGQRIRLYGVESEVIGVAEPIRYGGLAQDLRPKLFHLLGRSGGGIFGGTSLVRHDGDPAPILAAIESRVKEVDGSLAVSALQPLCD
jgi:hypothetical protein